ncbi:MAG TPA: insulinase family protein, partial [Thermoanaerobaculia bacterium]|nr:insulinase family protein [Thermoanaerobaculia bacterium]
MTPGVVHAGQAAAPAAPAAQNLPSGVERVTSVEGITEYHLANGLQVLLFPDQSKQTITVNVTYKVGSRHEGYGETGMAHLLEHLVFKGSPKHRNIPQELTEHGSRPNGSTWYDRTNYFETLPATHLELGLWLESDRMGWLLPAMTAEKLEMQRQVVMNERRQRVDNQPYGRAYERLDELLFPAGHPYHWPVIGYMEDIAAATLEDVESFFRAWYTPDNAVLTLSGAFVPGEALELVRRYFDDIPPGPKPVRARPALDELVGPLRETQTDTVELARVHLAFRLPPYGDDDWYAADLLATVLSGGRSSPLYRDLVYHRQLAQDVGAFALPTELAGSFALVATARPEVEPETLEEAVREHLRRAVRRGGARARAQPRAHPALGRAAAARPARRPDVAARHLLRRSAPAVARARALPHAHCRGPAALCGTLAARRALGGGDRGAGRRLAALEGGGVTALDRTRPPAAAPPLPFRFPAFLHRRLLPGVDLYAARVPRAPMTSVELILPRGGQSDPSDARGIASLTADLLDEGTEHRSGPELADWVERLGGSLSGSADWDASYVACTLLAEHLPQALALLAEVALAPSFPEAEVERLRKRRLAELMRRRSSPAALAEERFARALYGDGAYGYPMIGDEGDLRRLQRDAAARFYETALRRGGATLIASGDLEPEAIAASVTELLGGWPS